MLSKEYELNNRKLSKFEIWLKNLDASEIQVILVIILGIIILFSINLVVNYRLDKEKIREDIAIKNL